MSRKISPSPETDTSNPFRQQGEKLVGTANIGDSNQGIVAVSAHGNTAVVGGNTDDGDTGAVWVYTRTAGVWTQSGNKQVGTGASGNALQGNSVALSGDSSTLLSGGFGDDGLVGATWVFVQTVPACIDAASHRT